MKNIILNAIYLTAYSIGYFKGWIDGKIQAFVDLYFRG